MTSRGAVSAGFAIFYVLSALFVMTVFIPGSAYLTDNSYEQLAPPVAYRVLMPLMTDTLHTLVPQAVEDALTPLLASMRDSDTGRRLLQLDRFDQLPRTFNDEALVRTLIRVVLVFGWCLAFVAMLQRLARDLFPHSPATSYMAPGLFLWLLPVFMSRYAYTYDFAELFFSCACLWLLWLRRWPLYLLCFAFATLNKETSGFVIFFFAIWFVSRLPRQQFIQLLLAQLLIYGAIELAIISSYSHIPGSHGGTGLTYYINTFLRHLRYAFGYNYYSYLGGVATLMLVTYRWQEKPAFLFSALWMMVPNVVAYIFTCNVGEYRDLFWCMPVPVLLAAHSLVKIGEFDRLPIWYKQ